MAQPTTDTHDFSATPLVTKTFTPPTNTWMIEVIGRGLGMSSADQPAITFDNITTSTYRRSNHSTTTDAAADFAKVFPGSFNDTSGIAFHILIYGLQLAAPTVWINRPVDIGDTTPEVASGFQSAVTAQSDFQVTTNGGATINAGEIWIVYHRRNNKVLETVDFGAAAASSHDFTNITKNSVVMVAPALTLAVADEPGIQVSADGITFDAGVTDYRRASNNAGGQTIENDDFFYKTRFSATTNDFLAVIELMRVFAPTTLIQGVCAATANLAPSHTCGFRDNAVKHSALRLLTGGNNMTGGIVYLYGA